MMPEQALAGDAAALAALDAGCFAPGERWSETLWADELAGQDRLVVVHRDDGEIVAAATFQQAFETVDLMRVMVAPTRRGLGLAQQLVAAGAEWALARGADRMMLEVRHDNTAALGLYERLGFTTLDTRPDYYGAGLHARVMHAPLPFGGHHER